MKEEKKNVKDKALDNNSLEKVVGGIADLSITDISKTIKNVKCTITMDITDAIEKNI